MGRKIQRNKSEAETCEDRITEILKEFRCYIEFDPELNKCIVVDHDSSEFSDGLDNFARHMRLKD